MSSPTSTDMRDVKEQLHSIDQKYERLKQQQFIFITALERSREHARDKTEPVSSVTQVQKYKNQDCSNSTDRCIFSLFLEIMADLEGVLRLLESSFSNRNTSCEGLDTCRELLNPNTNISQLRVHYPHNEINRLSCDEARNFYGGIVSVIPLALDRLSSCCKKATQSPTSTTAKTSPQQTEAEKAGTSADLDKSTRINSSEVYTKGTGGWHAGKPAWKPPGNTKR
ncbi:Sperm acrosome-associated protein 9 [Triplophysa tibetana]|uniref:Sperm acrosome-associated protein 9 n=1 Tax=Triplophysa tibetana TaxID=1572043 RepID=A0A5A9P7R6_9TELE|nr:Sperm acrosome-associated protein 9 [Triplophysa tibetana]